jgi:hypothetical protein
MSWAGCAGRGLVLRPGMRICSGDRRSVLFLPNRNVLALKAVKFRESLPPNFPQHHAWLNISCASHSVGKPWLLHET